jgi:two-component system, OmpR family, alkaline phosphatase synthesis response regulator PhoP
MPPEAKTEAKKSYSIFLVDDDRFLLDMYSLKFKSAGCAVEAIADSSAALDKLRGGFSPDIILLDLVMPVVTGFEFLETVRKEGLAKNTRIIVLSNQGAQEDVDKATALGAAGYIIKASSIPSEVVQQTFAIAEAKS